MIHNTLHRLSNAKPMPQNRAETTAEVCLYYEDLIVQGFF